MAEAELYAPILQALSQAGHRAFRNHIGLSKHDRADAEEQTVRHGLPPGSSDLIGWTSQGVFLAVEVKPPGWRSTPSYERSEYGKRQIAFVRAVRIAGGRAGFARSVEEALDIAAGGPGMVMPATQPMRAAG